MPAEAELVNSALSSALFVVLGCLVCLVGQTSLLRNSKRQEARGEGGRARQKINK
jgi:hypothetical protein